MVSWKALGVAEQNIAPGHPSFNASTGSNNLPPSSPFEEQHRIVAKVDKLMTQLHATHQTQTHLANALIEHITQ